MSILVSLVFFSVLVLWFLAKSLLDGLIALVAAAERHRRTRLPQPKKGTH